MKYYSKEFRLFLTGLLTGYRKMLEQSLAGSSDSNYHLLANDTKKQIDEAIKIAKPSAFNSTDKSFAKLQEDTEEYLRKIEESYREKEEALEKRYQKKEEDLEETYQNKEKNLQNIIDEKVKAEKQKQEETIRSELTEKFEQEKRTMISVERLPELLQQFFVEKGIVNSVQVKQAPPSQAPQPQTPPPQAEQAQDENEDNSFDSDSSYDFTNDKTE